MTTPDPPVPVPGAPVPVPGATGEPAPDGPPLSGPARARRAFRVWRRTRPFWAALWIGLGGFVIFFLPMAPLGRILQVGVGGIAGMAGGVVIMAMALLVLFLPGQRHTAGTIAVIAGVASFPLSNLGGLFAGMALSVLGGAMAFGWLPEKPARRRGLLRRDRATAGGTPVSVGSGSA
ncbi:DUF6114 domain-containing protein [Streptomyces griseus]|uniref:DUF6114 domain-containing protein n=1 Tax=Streptomyces griseus TaxID=1911 RepID=UPI000AF759F5|nr:DUF6114 domain-containing protein [Streptomyces griseus]